ncbi:MAG: bifunctional acetate--CoA ligase family protein/GNAT family N-acetyltransferase, partial [Chlamydiia bacterium]|nr:bifunctional acetate--CoA ligase family protein/GNAT family N-acetyltransferase [Chlamydiia bacterium]
VKDLPEPVDLAVIVVPAKVVPRIIQECVDAGVGGAIVISAGFKEIGPEGEKLEQEILKIAKNKLPIIGPNCLGVMNPLNGLNATFAKGIALPGNTAFISQSGAMCTSVLDWSFKEGIGFSSFVSIGSMADVDWGDLIDYLGGDPNTHSILIYMETIGDPRSFLSAAREIALEKPIIVIKPGRTAAAAKAAASHTGSLAGADDVFDAALKRVGVMRVDTISQLFDMASILSRQPKPKGPRLGIITNAGGPSVLATDSAVMHGAKIDPLSEGALEKLNSFLPAAWSHHNPVDILGDASAETYAKAVKVMAEDDSNDGLLVILSPQDVTDAGAAAESLRSYAHLPDKPILASWMGGASVAKGIEILNHAGIPTFEYPDDAAETFARMWVYSKNLITLYETPGVRKRESEKELQKRRDEAANILKAAKDVGRKLLDEYESKRLLALYGIPIVRTEKADTLEEAVKYAEEIGYPVVLKLFSHTITHKTDVGGVKLNLNSVEEVKEAWQEIKAGVEAKEGPGHFQGVTVQEMVRMSGYEVILGSSIDPQLGPILVFGTGGELVEVYKDRAIGLPPLNRSLASHLMQETKIYEALKGVRGRDPVDLPRLEEILVRFSEMIVENREIEECDINPLKVSDKGIIALDARVLLHDDEKPILPLAIRPYPDHYTTEIKLKDGKEVTLRLLRPEDEPLMVEFHKDLSENSVRQRFFEFISLSDRVQHERLTRICFNDYDRELPLAATADGEILGVGRLTRHGDSARLTLLIRDRFHRKGLGTALIHRLLEIAKEEGISQVTADVLSENEGMLTLLSREGFQSEEKDGIIFTNKLI